MSAVPEVVSAPASPAGKVDPQLSKIRDLIYQTAGIYHPDNKLRLLEDRCNRRWQALNLPALRDYLLLLSQPATARDELVKLLNEITVGETCFFRSQPQLDSLKAVVLSRILAARASAPTRKLRFWSAGCSTGEEPYTLAIFLLEQCSDILRGRTFEIQATDLNERSLAHAQAGVFGTYSTRNINDHYRRKYFTVVGDKLQIGPPARKLITFSRLNLLDPSRMSLMKDMDLIFCANVLIYFDLASKRTVINHFYENLLPQGYFFLGQAESLFGVDDRFKLVHLPSATGYVKASPTGGKA